MPDRERINEMWRRTRNPEPRQFGSFSSSVKSAIASTRHCSVWAAQAVSLELELQATVPETSIESTECRCRGSRQAETNRPAACASQKPVAAAKSHNRQKKIFVARAQ